MWDLEAPGQQNVLSAETSVYRGCKMVLGVMPSAIHLLSFVLYLRLHLSPFTTVNSIVYNGKWNLKLKPLPSSAISRVVAS